MTSGNREYDDLTKITQLGETRQDWLRNSLHVYTYKELAHLSVEKIQAQLKADGKSAPESYIETWIAEANTFSESARKAQEAEATATDSGLEKEGKPTIVSEEIAESSLPSIDNAAPSNDGWNEYVTFLVFFEAREIEGNIEKRTKASVLEEEKWMPPSIWPEIERDQLFEWMLEQAGEEDWSESLKPSIPEPTPKEPGKKQPSPEKPVKVKITQTRLFQPPQAETPVGSSEAGQPFPEPIRAGESFALEVSFSLSGEAAASIASEDVTYLVRIIAFERNAKTKKHLGDTIPEALAERILDYSVKIPEVTLETGSYQLGVLVRVQAKNTIPDFIEVPELEVK